MLTIHHLNNSRSQRVLWLLEELNLPYEIQFYQRDPKTKLAPPELKKIHPLGKSPVLTDSTKTIAESGVILEYLVQTYGRGALKPSADSEEWLRYTYWMQYAEGSAMPPLLLSIVFSMIPKQPMPFFIKPVAKAIASQVKKVLIAPQLKTHMDFIESELSQRPWFAGAEFSAADIQMSFPIEAFQARSGADFERDYPQMSRFLKAIHSRPAYKKALEKGGPFSLLF